MPERLTREQAAIVGLYTGTVCGPFRDIHAYAEKLIGRPIWTHELRDTEFVASLSRAARADFMKIVFLEN